LGMKLAQVALSYGADDLHGTIVEEKIFHMAGATSPQLQTEAEMIKAIREAGRIPVQRNTFYEPIKTWEETPPAKATTSTQTPKVLQQTLATASLCRHRFATGRFPIPTLRRHHGASRRNSLSPR